MTDSYIRLRWLAGASDRVAALTGLALTRAAAGWHACFVCGFFVEAPDGVMPTALWLWPVPGYLLVLAA